MIVCGTGHRPEKIGGYNPLDPLRVAVRAEVERRLLILKPETVISGMALGFDQDLAALCMRHKIPFIAAVPFQGQERTWNAAARRDYTRLLAHAREVVYVSPPGYSVKKMHVRNEWMVHRIGPAGVVLAVWDGSDGGTASCIAIAEARRRRIERINPRDLQAYRGP